VQPNVRLGVELAGLPPDGSAPPGRQARVSVSSCLPTSPAPLRGFLCVLCEVSDIETNCAARCFSRGFAASPASPCMMDNLAPPPRWGFFLRVESGFRHRNQSASSSFKRWAYLSRCVPGAWSLRQERARGRPASPHDACRHLAPPRSGGVFSVVGRCATDCGMVSVGLPLSQAASPLYGNLSPASAGLFHAGPPRSAQPTALLGVGVVGLRFGEIDKPVMATNMTR
jgi:hypothetical protein